jgi:phosphatidylethanolamine/phosphatidyl-N-methylethanolamine N-methyltransferase
MSQPHESRVYSDLARFYDFFFGRVFVDREHEVIESLNLRPGNRVLEVGVGTGIALDGYPPYAHVVAIDPSADMLARAKNRVTENGWGHIELRQGDALNLDYPDNSFDYVTSFHVLTVVPDPYRMISRSRRISRAPTRWSRFSIRYSIRSRGNWDGPPSCARGMCSRAIRSRSSATQRPARCRCTR